MKLKLLLTAALLISAPAFAATDARHPMEVEWSFNGPFGTYDRHELQRGFQVYKEVCAACHAMKHLSYRNLEQIGFTAEEVKAIASQYEVQDGPNDEGEMFTRPGRPSDRFVSPYKNEKAARAANNGAYPPDLSLMTKARHDGSNYVYSLLLGYDETPPEGMVLGEGMNYNPYFPGGQIAMGKMLSDGAVTYADGTEATAKQMAHDVTAFLTFAAEPEMEERKRMGVKVILFLAVFAGIMYGVKRKIWADVQH